MEDEPEVKEEVSAQDKIDGMKQTDIEKLEVAPLGEFIANTTEKPFTFAYQLPVWDKPKKFIVQTRPLMHTVRLKITKEVWREADKDEKMFSYLFQLETMKKTFVSVNGKTCDTAFWEFMDDEWIETVRTMLFGPNPLEVSPFSGVDIKNLQKEFMKAIENGAFTGNELPGPKNGEQA